MSWRGDVRQIAWILFLLLFYSSSLAGTKEQELPDREMLRIMELLREWEMIKNLDMMQQLGNLDRTEGSTTESGSQYPQRGKTKDKQK
jgi:hypothetical protein